MKGTVAIIALALLLALPVGVHAEQPGTLNLPTTDLEYTDLTVLGVRRLGEKSLQVRVRGVGIGWTHRDFDGNGVMDVEAVTLEQGFALTFKGTDEELQSFRFEAKGLSQGRLQSGPANLRFRGRISGSGDCDSGVCSLDTILVAKGEGGSMLTLAVAVGFQINGAELSFTEATGGGVLQFAPLKPAE